MHLHAHHNSYVKYFLYSHLFGSFFILKTGKYYLWYNSVIYFIIIITGFTNKPGVPT